MKKNIDQNIRDIDVAKTWCLQSTLNFTRYMFKHKTGRKFIVGDHHAKICEALDKVVAGEIKRLIINIAPRYGKTELAVKSFIAYGLALNPKSKFIHLSYSDDLVLDSSSEIQNTINEEYFQRLFPVELTSKNSKKWYTTEGGGMYAVSSSGQVTGFGAGVVEQEKEEENEREEMSSFFLAENSEFAGAIIIDDPIKPDEAFSDTVREKVNMKFETTIRNRVNSRNTPIIIIMQRLHERDLCGYLKEIEPNDWTVLSLPCITTDETGQEHALWEFKHTLEELHKIEAANSYVFETQYMQNPKPLEGLMYQGFKTYETIPTTLKSVRKNYTDTADTGSDYLCSICYNETEIGCFVTDVLYTKKPMEVTEPATAQMLFKNNTELAVIEGNNGGRGFARNVERESRLLNNTKTKFISFHQSDNKAVRIFTKSADVQNTVIFPNNWSRLWPEFYKDLTGYRKEGGNKNDDAPDAVTGIVEKLNLNKSINTKDIEALIY